MHDSLIYWIHIDSMTQKTHHVANYSQNITQRKVLLAEVLSISLPIINKVMIWIFQQNQLPKIEFRVTITQLPILCLDKWSFSTFHFEIKSQNYNTVMICEIWSYQEYSLNAFFSMYSHEDIIFLYMKHIWNLSYSTDEIHK
jgi:hypothetical protein